MPMLRHAVGPNAFVALHKKVIEFRFPSRAAYPAQARSDDAARFDQLRSEQRDQRQKDTGGVTTGAGDQLRLANLVRINLRQTIDRPVEQIRRAMFVAVEFTIYLRILDSEVRAKIDDARVET